MFWWLSFIRPPPISCSTGEIDFIIQISNDLRTESYPEPIDVYYHWISSDQRTITPATKLTTWRPENTHKLLIIAGPLHMNNDTDMTQGTVIPATGTAAPHVTVTWRLGLFTSPTFLPQLSSSHPDVELDGRVDDRVFSSSSSTSTSEKLAVDLGDGEQVLSRVLPLYSAPILFDSSSGGPLRKGANIPGGGQALHSKSKIGASKSPSTKKSAATAAGIGTDKRNNKSSANNVKKQDEIQRIFGLPISPSFSSCDHHDQHTLSRAFSQPLAASPKVLASATEGSREVLSITEKTSFDLDKKLWDSAIGLGSWFVQRITGLSDDSACPGVVRCDNQADRGMEEEEPALTTLIRPGCRVLELGTGCGFCSIILGALLSRASIPGPTPQIDNFDDAESQGPVTRIHATDLESAVPLIERNIASNLHLWRSRGQGQGDPKGLESGAAETQQPQLPSRTVQVSAGVLDWEDGQLPQEVQNAPPDVIMMSDVTYNTSSFPALIKTLKRLINISPNAWVILAYKERHSAERTAWNMFEDEVKIRLKKVKEVKGAGGAPVEIWIGQSHLYTNSSS
ncbi:hypothetical protein CPB86DRAFT_809881 [Serendipita vermifera]|nr:hypothetical protein CPB86DRAFT_809881 [Serendipita vermifera]